MSEALKRAAMGWAADLDVIANNLTGDAEGLKLEECASVLADIACDLRGVAFGDSPAAPDPLDTPVCPRCGSHEVEQDATAAYDRDTGTWVIADYCDTLHCNACGEIGETVTLRHFRPRG